MLAEDLTPFLTTEEAARLVEERNPFKKYQTDPIGYAQVELGLSPWPGCKVKGQRELFLDVAESVRRQLAGEETDRIFRVEAGNGIGKTFGGAMLVNWFFDAFAPSIIITTAPTKPSVVELLWKDIKAMRPDRLPGRVLPTEPRMVKAKDHWAIGKTTSNAGGRGEERFKGQHHRFLMFVLDEAEGLQKFVYDAVHRMMTGGLVILVLIFANPRTRTSEFFKWGERPGVMNYRLSALDHPNVLEGREVVPGATSRKWVDGNIDEWCQVVGAHNEDDYTFEVPWHPGVIYKPNADFLCSVMGIPPANSSDDTLIASGRYDGAVKRWRLAASSGRDLFAEVEPGPLRIGVDVALMGLDKGTIYGRLGPLAWRVAQMNHSDYIGYAGKIREEALRLHRMGKAVKSLHIRVDAGGGYGQGVVDQIKHDPDLKAAFPDFRCILIDFGGRAHDQKSFDTMATNLYADAAESLKGLMVVNPPVELGPDLTERRYLYVNRSGKAKKRLEEKLALKKPERLGRSPDDGDGFVLAVASDFLFTATDEIAWEFT